jgi:hypothetical protein
MKFKANWCGLLASLLAGVVFAAPHDPGVLPNVLPVPGQVSLSRTGLETYASYLVTIQNNTTNALNAVKFTGTTTPPAGSTAVAATIESVISLSATTAGCALTDTFSISCSIGTLAPGANFEFIAVVKAPTAGTSIDFTWTFAGSEGNSVNGCCIVSGTRTTQLVDAATEIDAKKNVRSFVKPSGGTFFTGNGSVALTADPFVTSVSVPGIASYTSAITATIAETDLNPGVAPNCSLKTCFQSQITIPGTYSPYLGITLRLDASQIKPGTKIESVLITYEYLVNADLQSHIVGMCSTPTTPRPDGLPCLASRVSYKNKLVPGWTPDKDGDFEWTLLNIKNGTYKPGF